MILTGLRAGRPGVWTLAQARVFFYFTKRPNRLWNPGNKATGGVKLTTHLHLVQRLKMSGVIHLLHPYMPSRRGQGQLRVFRRVRKIAKSDISFGMCVLSARPSAWNNSAPREGIFIKFDIWEFFENLSSIIKFHLNATRININLHEGQCTFMTISRWILLRNRDVSDNRYRVFHDFRA
jgi:hypothetical protein